MTPHKKLDRQFYERPTLQVAIDLLGKYVVFNRPDGKLSAKIVEVEAYIGENDPACHAARGKTDRNAVMFGPGGFSYVYFIYGMYHCLNFVTESSSKPAAVLVRAAEPEEGIELMQRNSPGKKNNDLLKGPGCFCRSLGLTKEQSGLDLTKSLLYLQDRGKIVKSVARATRVGIKVGTDKKWRFFDKNSEAVSATPSVRLQQE
jgi:DNA-3-methyladenine glycosylase